MYLRCYKRHGVSVIMYGHTKMEIVEKTTIMTMLKNIKQTTTVAARVLPLLAM